MTDAPPPLDIPAGWRRDGPVAVIPARDEAERLPFAIAALARQGVASIVVANGCTDGTAAVALSLGAAVIDLPGLPGGVGAARRVGMAAARRAAPDAPLLLTTDADCTLADGTVAVLRAALATADAAFGRVEPDPAEFAALPRHVRSHGALEDLRDALMAEIASHARPQAWNPRPCHGQSPGALIAFRPEVYDAVGGFDPLPCNEDRGIAAALLVRGYRIARPWQATVHASCRLAGRAPGGMAETILGRTRSDLSRATVRLERQVACLLEVAAALRASGPAALLDLDALLNRRLSDALLHLRAAV